MKPVVAAADDLQTEVQLGRGVDDDLSFARFSAVPRRRCHSDAGKQSPLPYTCEKSKRHASFLSMTPSPCRGIQSRRDDIRWRGLRQRHPFLDGKGLRSPHRIDA